MNRASSPVLSSHPRTRHLAGFLCCLWVCAAASQASGASLALSAGWFDFTRGYADSAAFGAEWRGDSIYAGFLPLAGAWVNTDGGAYEYAGLGYDWAVAPRWDLTPSVAAGLWERAGSAHLGGPVEFRTGIELDYNLDNGYRLGLEADHVSNAGIYRDNPGAESLLVLVTLPLGR